MDDRPSFVSRYRVHGGREYLYRAIGRDGALVDVMLSEHATSPRKAFFRSAKAATGVTPDRLTTDGHDAYPRAIRTELGKRVRHRTNRYLNSRLEQDHRRIKGRCRPMLGFKSTTSARRYCRGHDELPNFLRCRSRMRQHIPAATRRLRHMRRTAIALGILEAAQPGSTACRVTSVKAPKLTEPNGQLWLVTPPKEG
jgi:transposase-like protein